MPRAIVCVLDSLGVGHAPDAAAYGDEGAHTLGSIAQACAAGQADRSGLRQGPLKLPNLCQLGLDRLCGLDLGGDGSLHGAYGSAQEQSAGKDTPSGHWEMMGVPVTTAWGTFPKTVPCFPEDFMSAWQKACDLPGVLGNCHRSGTEIIAEHGDAHCATGHPIVYTSSDSVFQIAAHEKTFGLERLYHCCEVARNMLDTHNIARVIARPFDGTSGHYQRTGNRRDFSMPPPEKTLLDHCLNAERQVHAVGKIADIFAHQGISKIYKAHGNDAIFDATLDAMRAAKDGDLVFSNFVDFDMLYGHRRDVIGYAAALEAFDQRLAELRSLMQADDLLLLTADHGCDPTWPGFDHTREQVPVLFDHANFAHAADNARQIGSRSSFADMGQTLAKHLQLSALPHGTLIPLPWHDARSPR